MHSLEFSLADLNISFKRRVEHKGKIFLIKPYCSHLGCMLSWNNLDKTWDCPCHGSRFNYEGKQIYDPAIKDLEKIEE